jgi:EAL domain-containing protein (putative c-di-GMP-specific phosphodiesterase class I)/DNA-binding NarL/FixJ family response regulator
MGQRIRQRRMRILIAEDDPAMRAALDALVASDEGLELVASVGDAEAAVAAAVEHRPDVCVLDVAMPGGGGVHATRRIRASLDGTRVVALSGMEDRETVVEMLRAGAAGYVVKGTATEEILDAIHRTARGEATLSRAVTSSVVGELSDQWARDERARRERDGIASRIRRSIEEGLLEMVLQPICELGRRRAVGYEALSRFHLEPQQPPNVWFAEAAEVGLLAELEMAAVESALALLPSLAPTTFLTVNVSPATAATTELLEAVSRTRAAGRVVIEITEHAPIDDYEQMGQALARLRRQGVRVAIDDAGAGFASLRHIVRLAPELIKIDGALTRDITASRTQRALTSALIAYARETGTEIVAEGLETDAQIAELRKLGVGWGQGYRLGRPAPPAVQAERHG